MAKDLIVKARMAEETVMKEALNVWLFHPDREERKAAREVYEMLKTNIGRLEVA